MTEPTITALPPSPIHTMEIWSNPREVAARFQAVFGAALPAMGCTGECSSMIVSRFEPTVWLVEGDTSALAPILGEDGALTAIGGGVMRVRIAGPEWRSLLMESGVFDAESPAFAPGCCAATIIDHVAVRLRVESDEACIAYLPASYAGALIDFWSDVCPLSVR